jgi:hypothetical protein
MEEGVGCVVPVIEGVGCVVPVIDISPFVDEATYDNASRAKVAREWDVAMSNIGFAIIQGM